MTLNASKIHTENVQKPHICVLSNAGGLVNIDSSELYYKNS